MCTKAKKNKKSKVDMDAMERVTRRVLAFNPDKKKKEKVKRETGNKNPPTK